MEKKKIEIDINAALLELKSLNTGIGEGTADYGRSVGRRAHRLQKVLVANRGEIAKRFFLALHEEGIPSVAIVTDPDRGQSWYEFADEVLFMGYHDNYARIPAVVAAVLLSGANAVYSGYGFLSENADFVQTLEDMSSKYGREIIFMGPSLRTMRLMGNKASARRLVREHGIPLFDSTDVIKGGDGESALRAADTIGYPVMLKLCSGGGGKGMSPAFSPEELKSIVASALRIGRELYNDQSFYLERYIDNPLHIEVQIFNGRTIGLRKCAVQRRNQKIIEESGHEFLDDGLARCIIEAAESVTRISGYDSGGGSGTVEFLIDADQGTFGFLEMNTRLQVEYAVTDQSLGIDIAKWQILYFDGRESEIMGLDTLRHHIFQNDHSIECRIYAEDPENDYLPSPGTIVELDLPTFNGIRCDFGFTEGDAILPMYDPLIGKLIAHGSTRKEAIIRLERALQELYIKGVKTNVYQLLRIVRHEGFQRGNYTNTFLKKNPELSKQSKPEVYGQEDTAVPLHVIFGGFSAYIHEIQRAARDFMVIASVDDIMLAPADSRMPARYTVQHSSLTHAVEFLELSVDTFICIADGRFAEKLVLISMNDRADDLIMVTGKQSFRVRINRQGDSIDLRMKDRSNKVNYYRMTVTPEGHGKSDSTVRLVSPFQGTFIAFTGAKAAGDSVKEGEPLMVLSSMKMETVFNAPASGRLAYLIEDGDMARLQIALTGDGRVIGKSIQEGEVLAIVETDSKKQTMNGPGTIHAPAQKSDNRQIKMNIYEHMLGGQDQDSFIQASMAEPVLYLELLLSAIQGIILQPHIATLVLRSFTRIEKGILPGMADGDIAAILERVLLHYIRMKKIFSPIVLDSGYSFQEELGRYIREGRKNASPVFTRLLDEVRVSYGLDTFQPKTELKDMVKAFIFYLCKRSFHICQEHHDLIKRITESLITKSKTILPLKNTLLALMEQEQSEPDDSLVKYIRNTVVLGAPTTEQRYGPIGPYRVHRDQKDRFSESLHAEPLSADALTLLCEKLNLVTLIGESLEKAPAVRRLYSPFDEAVPLLIERDIVHLLIFLKAGPFPCLTSKDRMKNAKELLAIYGDLIPDSVRWVHICAADRIMGWDRDHASGIVSIEDIARNTPLSVLQEIRPRSVILDARVSYPHSSSVHDMILVVSDFSGRLRMDPMPVADRGSPYHDPDLYSRADQRLFDISKYPVESWASLCFDGGAFREIRIPSIDGDEKGHDSPVRQVGARIFTGSIDESPACFYMKDSRVSGGSTGDREGLKYCAAAYLAYLNDWPLYVWNDSAGANIMDGIMSLNRGAQGFMMNTLLGTKASHDSFVSMTENSDDPSLSGLFSEVRRIFDLSLDTLSAPRRSFLLAAIGIGSSAGLDVYGSSQAPIQILLDSEQSYRVLTGSNVTYSVIGENISNYDIGGAKILGTWTGIVDIVAQDKLHLCSILRTVHFLFTRERDLPGINRKPPEPGQSPGTKHDTVLDEDQIINNVDGGFFCAFKKDYYAAQSLIGGFCSIGGRRTLIMGPRTDAGMRNSDAIIKARELLRTANRTDSHCILIFGRTLLQAVSDTSSAYQPTVDFIRALNAEKRGLRIHIIRHEEGMNHHAINASSDALIFVKMREPVASSISAIEKKAAFIAGSLNEAFDISLKIIRLIYPASNPAPYEEPEGRPQIPEDPGKAYEIIDTVITPTFDRDSFMEMYGDMNNPITGPHLITGLASLYGHTVGVMADQPLLKGGGADAPGTEKMRLFTEFLNTRKIPLIMLSNSSGFVPGSKQERYRIQAVGAESLDANILGRIPVVSVVLNQNYGGRLIQAFNKFLRPGIVYLARNSSVMAVLGVDAAFDILFGKKYSRLISEGKSERAGELKQAFYANYLEKARAANDGMDSGLVDWTIDDLSELRKHCLKGLVLAADRCRKAFGDQWSSLLK